MTSRLVAGSMIALLLVPGISQAAGKKSSGQSVGRADSLAIPILQAQRTSKLADLKSAAGRMQLASPLKLPGMAQVLAAAKSAGRAEKLSSQPARSNKSELTGPRSPSGVLQLMPSSDAPSSGQKVLTLLPQPRSGQKVLTLVPQPHPSAGDRSAQILQFSDDEPQPAEIMPLGTDKKSEPTAYILQFED